VELELAGEAWTANHPTFVKISPGARYVFPTEGRVHPYLGAFYQHTFYENLSDTNALGGRAGAYTSLGGPAYLSAGVAVSQILDCHQHAPDTCTEVYPEVGLSFAF
jgi:hypothetical protein